VLDDFINTCLLHHMTNLEGGHSQVHFLEALPIKLNSRMTSVVG
jgi:hypothetical protein